MPAEGREHEQTECQSFPLLVAPLQLGVDWLLMALPSPSTFNTVGELCEWEPEVFYRPLEPRRLPRRQLDAHDSLARRPRRHVHVPAVGELLGHPHQDARGPAGARSGTGPGAGSDATGGRGGSPETYVEPVVPEPGVAHRRVLQ